MRAVMRRVRWIALGAGLAWIFDPRYGSERRARIKDETLGLTRRAGEMTARRGHEAADRLDEVADDLDAQASELEDRADQVATSG